MPRPLWKGAISFGLVSIPVELHNAVRDTRPHFRMLHAKDKSPVRFERVCIRDGEPVAWQDLVKGYEIEKGHFVVLTRDDFKAAAVEKTQTVDILDFVKAEEIDDRFFEVPYYLTPGKGGDHAYALLREALKSSARVGIARFVLRDKQHLAAVEVIDQALVLSVMRFDDELVDTANLHFPARSDIRKPELDMARSLVDSLAAEWDPAKYTDQYRENLMKIIKGKAQKAKGKESRVQLKGGDVKRPAEVVDLMERLRQSLEHTKATPAKAKAKPHRHTSHKGRRSVA
jgi:DNA end-binding protein Ku